MARIGSKWTAVLLDFLERAGWSAAQVFYATILAGGGAVAVVGLPWKYASVLAASAGVSSVILTLVQYLGRFTNLRFWPDLMVRLAKTFVGSIAASATASGVFDITKFNWNTALNVAALATIGALGKGLLARGPAGTPTGKTPADQTPATAAASHPNPSTLPALTYLDAVGRWDAGHGTAAGTAAG